MDGKILCEAVKVLSCAGRQIEQLMDKCVEQICGRIEEDTEYRNPKVDDPDFEELDDYGWAVSAQLVNIKLYEKRKKKPSAQIAIKVVLCDEEESNVANWQPAIYVMFDKDKFEFEYDSIKLRGDASELLKQFSEDSSVLVWNIDDNNLEIPTGWMFMVPLVKINNEDDITRQIVEPAIKLIKGENDLIFPDNSVAFRFKLNDDNKFDIEA